MFLSLIGIILRWGFLIWELIFFNLLRTFFLILVVFVLFLLSLRFGQISPLAFLRWFLPRPRIGMLSLVTVSPVITAFHSCCLSRHVFDEVNLWPAWVGFEIAIFRQCSPVTVETERLYPLRHGPWRAIKDGFFCLINPYLVFQSRVRTECFELVFNWNHFEMRKKVRNK